MTAPDVNYLMPELGVALAAVLVFVADLLLPSSRRKLLGPIAALLLLAVFTMTFFVDSSGSDAHGTLFGGAGPLYFQRLFLGAAVIGILGGLEHVERQTHWRQGEYYFLLLCSLLGMMILPGARDLILLLIAFELMGIPLYVLAAFEPGEKAGDVQGKRASEAGLKLFMVGSASTAITLFGLSLVAGLAGGTSMAALHAAPATPLFTIGEMFILAGIAFKLGVAPFHMWVPDTYEGAPGPFVSFLAASPKAAGIAALCALFLCGFGGVSASWQPAVEGLALVTMAVGSLLAIPQHNLRRLLAYSGVAQVGYLLIAFATGTAGGVAMVLFFAVTYVATNAGIFLVAHAVAVDTGDETDAGLKGLAGRSPWLALALLAFLLSLAGIPFVAGFWAKLYVFLIAWQAGLYWLVAAGASLSVVSLFFYLLLARAAYLVEPTNKTPARVAPGLRVAIIACLIAVVGIGLYPAPLLDAAQAAAQSFLIPIH